MNISEYCICGGSMVGNIRPDSKATLLVRLFWEQHHGIGHEKCNASKCYSARRKAGDSLNKGAKRALKHILG
ncbi:MAG: hypothetical protein ACFFDI_25060 [Promethearchaeota archaeon]